MKKIIDSYLETTPYGLQLVVKTEEELWYRQIHLTLEYNGGGTAAWVEVDNPFFDKQTT